MYVEFEPGEKFSKNLSQISESHEHFKDAGWVLTEDDYVIDIDTVDKEIIKKIIATFDIGTQVVWTERGAHFYFKKPKGFKRGANRISPLGFAYEIKYTRNTKAVTVKTNGKLRTIENEGIREEAPFIFSSNMKFENLQGIEDGEGRNNKLFALRSKLGNQKDWRKILYFINDNIFAESLDEEEMDTLTREMFVEAAQDNQYEVASWLMNKLDFLQYGVRYYFKDGDEYTHELDRLQQVVYDYVGAQRTSYVDEVIKQMEYRSRKLDQDTVFDIKFKNGYLRDGEFVELITEDFSPYSIDIEYEPDAEPVGIVDDYIDNLTGGEQEYKDLLLEALGSTLIVDPEFKRLIASFFIFVGDGGNGKGTLLTIIRTILGSNNVTGMGISELTDERYLSSFKGMLANLGDDLEDQPINDRQMKVLKNLSSCDYIATRELYKSAENMFFTGSLIFTSNHILKSWEKGKSYERRVNWLPMYIKVVKKDPLFITKLTTDEALKYWIKLIIDGYKRLYKNGKFTKSPKVQAFNDNYHRENNPALDYLMDMSVEDFHEVPIRDVNDRYKEWCEDNVVNYSAKMLSDTLLTKFGIGKKVMKVNGKATRCFVREN